MKKIFIVLSFFFATQLFAQQFEGTIYLKNGSTVQGTIIKIVPNETVEIKTKELKTRVFNMDEVLKITKGSLKSNNSTNLNYSEKFNYTQETNDSELPNYSNNFTTRSILLKRGERLFNFKIGLYNTGAAYGGFLIGVEFGIINNILSIQGIPTSLGVGATLGLSMTTEEYDSYYYSVTYERTLSAALFGGNVYLHFDLLNSDKFDTYVMGSLDYISRSIEVKANTNYGDDSYVLDNNDLGSSFSPNILLGIRYSIEPKVAVNFELGTGFCTLRLGLDYKF